MTSKGFDNSVIIPLRNNKPHIVFMNGFWRVSAMDKKSSLSWFALAHAHVNKLNEPIAANRPWGYKNVKQKETSK